MIAQIMAGIAGVGVGCAIILAGIALYFTIPLIILEFRLSRERREQVGKWTDCGQIDRPCGACAHCGYTGRIERETCLFRNRVTVRQYCYCGITNMELTREQAFHKSDCAHWTPCAALAASKGERRAANESQD